MVAIINKSDLPRRIDIEKIREKIGHLVQISASEGEGVQALEQEICPSAEAGPAGQLGGCDCK